MSIWKRLTAVEMTTGHLERMVEIYYERLTVLERANKDLRGLLARHKIPDERKTNNHGRTEERRRSW